MTSQTLQNNAQSQTVAPCGRAAPKASSTARPTLDDWKQALSTHLVEKGLKNSEQRLKIAEVLLSISGHFRVQEVARLVQEAYPEIGPATVYRAMNLFRDAGLLKETLVGDGGEGIYEVSDGDHHDHIVCLDCGHIYEFHDQSMEERQDKASKAMEFSPERHRHVIYARCDRYAHKGSVAGNKSK